MKLVGYVRVSTVKQVEGTSLTTQKEHIEAYCKMHGHELVQIFADEGKSGKQGSNRPQYDFMLKRVDSDENLNGIIVASLSRFGRGLSEVVDVEAGLRAKGKVFISIKENFDMSTKEGRMTFGVIAVINEYERELINERTQEGRAYADIYGSRSGKPCHRPQKEIDWKFVEGMRAENMSWGGIAKAISFNPDKKISKVQLIKRARERGMKID
jgi:site-specific DNA recombinase